VHPDRSPKPLASQPIAASPVEVPGRWLSRWPAAFDERLGGANYNSSAYPLSPCSFIYALIAKSSRFYLSGQFWVTLRLAKLTAEWPKTSNSLAIWLGMSQNPRQKFDEVGRVKWC